MLVFKTEDVLTTSMLQTRLVNPALIAIENDIWEELDINNSYGLKRIHHSINNIIFNMFLNDVVTLSILRKSRV